MRVNLSDEELELVRRCIIDGIHHEKHILGTIKDAASIGNVVPNEEHNMMIHKNKIAVLENVLKRMPLDVNLYVD